jgi:4-hydroxybenzoate polyprenyltransferase
MCSLSPKTVGTLYLKFKNCTFIHVTLIGLGKSWIDLMGSMLLTIKEENQALKVKNQVLKEKNR